MTLSISLSAEVEARLKERAAGAGEDPTVYASRIIEQAVRKPTLEEILAPVRAEFESTKMTDDQLSDLLEEAKHDGRRERRLADAT
jgi:hypothetical protein